MWNFIFVFLNLIRFEIWFHLVALFRTCQNYEVFSLMRNFPFLDVENLFVIWLNFLSRGIFHKVVDSKTIFKFLILDYQLDSEKFEFTSYKKYQTFLLFLQFTYFYVKNYNKNPKWVKWRNQILIMCSFNWEKFGFFVNSLRLMGNYCKIVFEVVKIPNFDGKLL